MRLAIATPFRLLLVLCLIGLLTQCRQAPADDQPRRIEILFLGHDSQHHNSEAYLPLLASALTPKGINFTYSSDPADLNAEKLAVFDALMLYANHDSIQPEQEKALLDFVREGKGFLPIHSASYCFRNSDAFVRLVGAQFASHDTATFTAEIIQAEHPVMQGVAAFGTWDETYLHSQHNPDRTVLMERVEGDHREPWTWVREYGEGRIFYTAYGHDERTWSHPGFHALIEKGILWAVGERVAANRAKLSFPSLTYSEAKIPNYEKRDPPPQLQAPLSPAESQQLIQVPPGFELQLFAAEPDINTPIAMAFDEKGRLWYLESLDYPNEINLEDGVGNDKIKIIEDTDGDGRADKFTVFADKLSVPTSLVFYDGGVIVSQAPHFLFLKDTTGDDKADIRRVIMSGWGTFDTHAGPSNLHYGFDNWIWGTVGYSSFEGVVGSDSLEFGSGVYRFKPDGLQMEFMGGTTNNTWGLGFTETFDVFASTANNTHSAYLGIPARHFEGVPGSFGKEVVKIDGHYAFHPITRKFRQVDVFGGFTAAAGHNLYTARSFPQNYWNHIAFVCEPTGHLLHNAVLEPKGGGFVEKDGWNILASSDEWVSPIHAEVGPDGALWIADWYNFIIQHNPTPPGFENGPGNAHINPLRDKKQGRIYRLVYKNGKASQTFALDKANPDQLLAALQSDNLLWRMHAQRLLVERDQTDVVDALLDLVADQSVDVIGLNSPAVHALWTLQGLGALNQAKVREGVQQALRHPAAGVRKAAAQVLPRDEASFEALVISGVLSDPDGHTRLAAILSLADYPTSNKIGSLLYDLSKAPELQQDEWLSKSLYVVMVAHKNSLIQTLQTQAPELLAQAPKSDEPINYLDPKLDVSDWESVKVPALEGQPREKSLEGVSGILWQHTTFSLSAAEAAAPLEVHLGIIGYRDETYVNGQKVGATHESWRDNSVYRVPARLLKSGENVLLVKTLGGGQIRGVDREGEVFYMTRGQKRSLAGTWNYHIAEIHATLRPTFINGVTSLSYFLQHFGPYAHQFAEQLLGEDGPVAYNQVIQLKTVQDQMQYDQTQLQVVAGSMVALVFENNDVMPHNFLLLKPGSLERVGALADQMAQSPEGMARGYVPESPDVLASTHLVDPGTSVTLRIQVPEKAGEYPYVCTFPGHWRIMNGVMKVVSKPIP